MVTLRIGAKRYKATSSPVVRLRERRRCIRRGRAASEVTLCVACSFALRGFPRESIAGIPLQPAAMRNKRESARNLRVCPSPLSRHASAVAAPFRHSPPFPVSFASSNHGSEARAPCGACVDSPRFVDASRARALCRLMNASLPARPRVHVCVR